MKMSHYNTQTSRTRELPPHAYHPNPSMLAQRSPYIAYPQE